MKISVIIPAYNAEQTILNTLESVRQQTFQKYEVIVVNDGSTDNTRSIVEEYCLKYSDISIRLINKPNGGVSTARNIGMREAKGEFIALLDSDDEWLPDKLQKQVEILNSHSEIDFIGCNRNNEKFGRFFFVKFDNLTRISARLLLYKNFFHPATVLFKKNILEDIGYFDENMSHGEDTNFFIRFAIKCSCYLLNEPLVITGSFKPSFGFIGLSADLSKMHKGELINLSYALNSGIIKKPEFVLLFVYTKIKYMRRIILTFLRKIF